MAMIGFGEEGADDPRQDDRDDIDDDAAVELFDNAR
jgi:hypothetical protein